MKVLITIGPSGSGKSSFVEQYVSGYKMHKALFRFGPEGGKRIKKVGGAVLSADDITFDEEGFHPERLGEAHAKCLKAFVNAFAGTNALKNALTLVVDNTNTTMEQIAPYIALALLYEQVELEVRVFDTPWRVCAERTQHGTPPMVIRRQYQQMQEMLDNWPPFWPTPTFDRKS